MVYLNHAGTSWPKPAPVRAAVAAALETPASRWAEDFARGQARVAAAFGAPDPARLLLTPGGTSALAAVLADLPWEPGDRLLISAFEHHALHRPALATEARGVTLEVLPRGAPDADGRRAPVDLDALEASLARGGVRAVAFTAASNVTGELLPVAEIAARAHAHGALVLLDAAQTAGWLPLDVSSLGVDMLAAATHKGLQAPWGAGVLWVAPHVELATPAAVCALPAPGAAPRDAAPPCGPMPGWCDTGSVDRAALAGLVAALDWLDEPARAERLARARMLAANLQAGLAELPGLTLHGPPDVTARLPTVAASVAGRAPSELAAALAARDVHVGAGLLCAPLAHDTLGTAPDGVLRFSVGPESPADDVEAALAALRAVLDAG